MNAAFKTVAIASVLLGAGAFAITREPQPAAFCAICDAQENHTAWQLRGTHWTFWQTHGVQATPMSRMLTNKKLVAAHTHAWLAPRFAPDPLNEFGPPVLESLEFIGAPRVVNFMGNVADYADPVTLHHWQEMILQPGYSYVIDGALRYFRVPENGFADRTAFLSWWGGNGYALYNRLREETEPD